MHVRFFYFNLLCATDSNIVKKWCSALYLGMSKHKTCGMKKKIPEEILWERKDHSRNKTSVLITFQ